MSDTKSIWEELRKPFPKGTVGMLPKPYDKNSSKGTCKDCGKYHGLPALHVDYVGHAAVTDRLNSVVGPDGWNWEPMAVSESGLPALDADRNLWIKLTVNGVTKFGVGDGDSMKIRIGDALRNGAMRFGIALDLWSKEELESTADHPELKNDKPSQPATKPAPARPPGTISEAQGKLLLARYRDYTGLTDWDMIKKAFVGQFGVSVNDLPKEDFDAILSELSQGDS